MPKEQTLIARFPSSTKAEKARQDLASIGVTDTDIKRNSKFGTTTNQEINNVLSQQAETLTGLTLFSANTPNSVNNDARVLMGADPSVSGMSAKGYGMAGGHGFTLIAFAPEDKVDQVKEIITQCGGDI